MAQAITKQEFIDAFTQANRENQFSRDGRAELFEYFQEYEESTGMHVYIDVIAICCAFTEYASMEEVCEEYDMHSQDIHDHTTVIQFESGVIVENF
jgi:hypothetical protein